MWRKAFVLSTVTLLPTAVLGACSSSKGCPLGAEGCPCGQEPVCYQGLSCVDGLCVNPTGLIDGVTGGAPGVGGAPDGGATGGSDGGGDGGSPDPGAGGTSGGTGGGSPGGGNSGGSGNSGTGGSGGPTIHWIEFDGSWASSSVVSNSILSINGGLYPFDDGCAEVNWNPETRCASGTLCSLGVDYENWGMAVGFDFINTGDEGEPPNTKMRWSASEQQAVGVAWRVTGTAPGLQVWLTNMDPVWQGYCDADACGIAGPPDGKSSTTLGAVDSMRFNQLEKDDWGGTGVGYTFDPDNILSLEFKMAAVSSGGAFFDFCVEQIGIIRNE